ncbi:OmpA family protein [Hyphomicrobium sp.]|mgnify:FL=1|uniref:OmpA family protein n=1 Tax=Hyphomicrobium sp. TaxID=82 RepID=UPI002FDF2CBA
MRAGCAGGGELVRRIALRFAVAGLCVAPLAIGAATLGIAQAHEQEADGAEVPIGTFTLGPREATPPHDGFSIVEPPAGVPERLRDSADDGSGRWFFQGWDTPRSRGASAEDLYRDGKAALDQGRRDEAQRLFERLIAEAPDSPRVAAARQYLGQIYRSVETAAPVAPARGQPGDPSADAELPWRSGGTASADARTGVAGVTQAVPRAVLYQARVSPVVDSEFLSDAGDRVFFGAGSTNLGARARGVIQAQARFLMRYPDLYAAVEGHADDGAMSDIETLRISEERAAVVRDRLVAEGVDAARLVAYGRAREERVSDCPAPECLAQNRRAVTVLLSRRVEAARQPSRRAQGGAPSSSAVSPTQ